MLGKGAFGEVFEGLLPDGQDIAVKRICASDKRIKFLQLKRELDILKKVSEKGHPNIMEYYGV